MSESIIEIRGVTRRFGRKAALDTVDLDVARGLVFGLVGENGAGKTTLIKHVLGLLKAQTGTVRTFELDPKRKIKRLSRGERAKTGLLVALAHRPDLLLLDEPSSGLDPVVRRDILGARSRYRHGNLGVSPTDLRSPDPHAKTRGVVDGPGDRVVAGASFLLEGIPASRGDRHAALRDLQDRRPEELGTETVLPILLAIVWAGSIVVTLWAFVTAFRRKHIGVGTVAVSVGIWIVLVVSTFCLFPDTLEWFVTVDRQDAVLLSLGSLAPVPAPPALAPLAVSWNRHR
ncbi:ATP-binding cassette domain-containing protein [Candidatus Sumerlaeota bacterium]|nr:ATP-binding cassette domain-containing protein [Candidatus Sumerlaeota bacterium]